MKKFLLATLVASALVGCDSDGDTTTIVQPADPIVSTISVDCPEVGYVGEPVQCLVESTELAQQYIWRVYPKGERGEDFVYRQVRTKIHLYLP
ncbi:hypothetical protein JCM19231_4248 [Vibrio ishigakensis]|uniref:Uncharacterized protein n=1 Tax=Vibrio ishigakensis TaxID=1481914 RepID=A0A0B8NXA0_9VIBR|nr:hypothetical protein JCM19231_4248 [Vibrio ishigakensis]